jgi:hypothetical protein
MLSIDPLAERQEQIHLRLPEVAPPVSEELQAAWRAEAVVEQFLVVVTCRDEGHQVELRPAFMRRGAGEPGAGVLSGRRTERAAFRWYSW